MSDNYVSPKLLRPLRDWRDVWAQQSGLGCEYCENEPEPGYIEMDNNGPIVPCPICNPRDGGKGDE